MATGTEESSNPSPIDYNLLIGRTVKKLEEAAPWIKDALAQAQVAQRAAQEDLNAALSSARSRFSEIRATSSAHFQQTIESLKDVKAEFDVYEAEVFGKMKEGVLVAAANPVATGAVSAGLGTLVLKAPRRFLYRNTIGLLVSEEALLAKNDTKVKELRRAYERLKAEKEKLERTALLAEEEMKRGTTKLRQAGDQIRRTILSTQKLERKARGLKDILGELPSREAYKFRSQVSNLISESKKERKALTKEVLKISNYGISV